MFSSSCKSSSPFSLRDLDMWDTKSIFTAKTSAWCGMASVSGSEFLSKVSTSTSGSAGGFRQNEPGLRRWQSLSHLPPQSAPQLFPRAGAELRAARHESSYRQAEVRQWLQDAHEHLDIQLARLNSRDMQLGYNITTAQLLDIKHKQLSEAMSALEQENEAAELPQFEKTQRRGELHEKVLKLQKDLLQMRSTLNRGSNDQPPERAPGSLSRTLEKQQINTELSKLREALREAEARARTQEEERNKTLQRLQTSTETQRTLLTQIEEMNKRLHNSEHNHSEVQEQLSEANNKISQACLEKAILSTQLLKLEDSIKELKAKLSGALSDKHQLIQEKADLLQRARVLEGQLTMNQPGSEDCELHDHLANTESHNSKQDKETVLMKEDSKALREVHEKLRGELETMKQKMEISQCQLEELSEEKIMVTKHMRDLDAQRLQLIREKEELLSKINEGGHEELTEMKEKCCQHRESVQVLELENQKLRDQNLCLEVEVLEKEKMLHLQEEEYRKQDAVRVQSIEEVKAVATHWTEKWQKAALTLQSTQDELEEFKKNSRNEGESDSLLRAELDACKQELELERSRSQVLLHSYKDEGGEAVQNQDKETATDFSASSLLWEQLSDSQSRQNSPSQLLKKVCEGGQDDGSLQVGVTTNNSLRGQLDESRIGSNQQQQEKMLTVQKLNLVKDEKPSVEGRKDQTDCPVNLEADQQRRTVTEQGLFMEGEGKEAEKTDRAAAAAQTGASSLQDWTPISKVVRAAVDRRSWQQGSSLMPVFEEEEEEEEEDEDEEEEEEEDEDEEEEEEEEEEEDEEPAEETHTEENLPTQTHQMSAVTAETSNLKAKTDSLLQGLSFKQPIQDLHTAEKVSDKSSHCLDECDLQGMQVPPLYPDGIFLAEPVDICSPDEDEEEGGVK